MKISLSGITKNHGNVSFELNDLIELHITASNDQIGGLFQFNQEGQLAFRCGYAVDSFKKKGFAFMCDGSTIQAREENDY